MNTDVHTKTHTNTHTRDRRDTTVEPLPVDIDPIDQLAAVLPRVTDVVDHVTGMQMHDPTPCEDFHVHDVLNHMFVLGGAFAAMYRGEEPGEITAPAVYGWVPAREFRAAMDDLLGAIRSPGALGRTIASPVGDLPGDTFARFLACDALLHGWDLAQATGQSYEAPDDLVGVIDRFAREAITPELRATGMFADPVEPSPGATPIERLAAFSGRAPFTRQSSASGPSTITRRPPVSERAS